jgi:hypothetical protein
MLSAKQSQIAQLSFATECKWATMIDLEPESRAAFLS